MQGGRVYDSDNGTTCHQVIGVCHGICHSRAANMLYVEHLIPRTIQVCNASASLRMPSSHILHLNHLESVHPSLRRKGSCAIYTIESVFPVICFS